MTSIFGKLRGNATPGTPQIGLSPNKKAGPLVPQTPLEKLLEDAGPQRDDGSDKFFGMVNTNNTCYCNSVVQCLYFSEPFREQVMSYPKPGRPHSLHGLENTVGKPFQNGTPVAPRTPGVERTDPLSPKKLATNPTSPSSLASSSEENKNTWESQKKAAYAAGPHLRLDQGYSETYGMQESLFTSLKDLFESIVAYQSRVAIVTPSKLLDTLRRNHDSFRQINTHQDAHEFLITTLNSVVDEVEKYSKIKEESPNREVGLGLTSLKSPANNTANIASSWVHELFEGTITSETRCLTCENASQRDETFLDLSVDLEEHSSITSCLRRFSEEEMLCERNKFHCDKCGGLQEAEKRIKIKRLPRVMALHLKRFKYLEDSYTLCKLFHRVVYPFHLRILNTTDDVMDPDRLYELYAVVVHLGQTPFHGHYVAVIKSKDRGWLLFDDELVIPVDKNYVRGFFGGDPRNHACAYVLFYQETTEESVQREQEHDGEDEVVTTADGLDMAPASSEGLRSPALTAETAPTPATEELDPFTSRLEHNITSLPISPPAADVDLIEGVDTFPNSTGEHHDRPVFKGPLGSMRKSGNFNRFRNTSLSIRTKPKFWGSSKDSKDPDRSEGWIEPEGSLSVSPIVSETKDLAAPDKDNKEKERKSRFGLGRKKTIG